MIFNNAMYYDTAVKSKEMLLGIVRNTINKEYTIDFAMRKDDSFLSDSDKNAASLNQVFNVKEL